MKIQGREVTEEDVGSKVTYVPRHAHGDASHKDAEGGIISSIGKTGIFVEYGRGTPKLTPPELLVWG